MKNLAQFKLNAEMKAQFSKEMSTRLCSENVKRIFSEIEPMAHEVERRLYEEVVIKDSSLGAVNSLPPGYMAASNMPALILGIDACPAFYMKYRTIRDISISDMLALALGEKAHSIGFDFCNETTIATLSSSSKQYRLPRFTDENGGYYVRNAISKNQGIEEAICKRYLGKYFKKDYSAILKVTAPIQALVDELATELKLAVDFNYGLIDALKPIKNLKMLKEQLPDLYDDFISITGLGVDGSTMPAIFSQGSDSNLMEIIGIYKARQSTEKPKSKKAA